MIQILKNKLISIVGLPVLILVFAQSVAAQETKQGVFTGTSWSEFPGGAEAACADRGGDSMDIDKDNDGLIEICYLEDLNTIRNNSRGEGTEDQGCPGGGCNGFELVRDLDFTTTQSYINAMMNQRTWTVEGFDNNNDSNTGWLPIGENFRAIFEGNGYSISNLQINRDGSDSIGLFNRNRGTIRNLGFRNRSKREKQCWWSMPLQLPRVNY